MKTPPIITRFAPSPTGHLHLGHAFAALIAHDTARQQGGRFLLRIEDIDHGRCRAEFETQIFDDLTWLGLTWDGAVRRQSEHMALYTKALSDLTARGLTYPCFCTRKEIANEVAAMTAAPHGPEGALYPGTCRALSPAERTIKITAGTAHAWRLDIEAAREHIQQQGVNPLTFQEKSSGTDHPTGLITADIGCFGDIVLGRKDTGVSYHLAVTLDDHAQGVSLVTRGADLFPATHIQRLLQALLGLATPTYCHHRLIYHESGRRLAKRDKDATLKAMREAGVTPNDIRSRLGLPIIQP